MKKCIFVCALIVALLFTNATLFSSAAGTELEQQYITVESYGTFYTQRVYTDKNGTIFVPVTMLAQFGKLNCSEGTSDYTFYRKSETGVSAGKREFLAGARTITIAKAGTTATVSCYTSKNVAKTVSTVNFSKSHTVDKKLYLPLAEALPLIDAKVEITKDGVVHIYANPISAFYALYSGNIDLCVFNAGDMIGGGFISASGLIVDTVLNLRFDRLDVVTNSGAIKDYSNLFKNLLVDNETYLSAFDKTETPLDKQISVLNSEIGDLSDFAGGVKDLVKAYEYLFSSTKHSTYKEFSKEASTGLHSGVDLISAADKIISYADRYTKQVEDHRNMLNAVYGGSSKPAAIAANEVYTLYGQNTTAQITSAATSELRSYLSKIFSGAVSSTAGLKPYKIAFDAVQFLLPEMTDTWSNAAELYFIANVVNDSYNVATSYKNNPKFDEASLEKQRLALIMMLISSKYGYETFYGEDYDILDAINPWLEKLYLAADSVECVSSGYYAATKAELQKSCSYIVFKDNSLGNTSKSENNSSEPEESAEEDVSTDEAFYIKHNISFENIDMDAGRQTKKYTLEHIAHGYSNEEIITETARVSFGKKDNCTLDDLQWTYAQWFSGYKCEGFPTTDEEWNDCLKNCNRYSFSIEPGAWGDVDLRMGFLDKNTGVCVPGVFDNTITAASTLKIDGHTIYIFFQEYGGDEWGTYVVEEYEITIVVPKAYDGGVFYIGSLSEEVDDSTWDAIRKSWKLYGHGTFYAVFSAVHYDDLIGWDKETYYIELN